MRLSRRTLLGAGAAAAALPVVGCEASPTPLGPAPTPSSSGSSSPGPTTPQPSSATPSTPTELPRDLLLGYATAAYQIEGAVKADGRGVSIWDTFCHKPGAIDDGSTGDVACDHYHRWKSDVDLMAELGTQTYRFSIAWPRIIPDGTGKVNVKGIDFYQRLIDRLRQKNIEPMATVYHWDLPQVLQDKLGWQNRDCTGWFADYAAAVFTRLSGVERWVTINEPKVVARSGHQIASMAPGIRSDVAMGRVVHHLALAHGKAVQAFRAAGSPGRIAMCSAATPVYPADGSAATAHQAQVADVFQNTLYLDPVLRGRYPALTDALAPGIIKGLRQVIRDGDLAVASTPVDELGVNYYSPLFVDANGKRVVRYPQSTSGQELYPASFRDLLVRLHRDYGLPMVVTEAGMPDYRDRDWQADDYRIGYLRDLIAAMLQAMAEGAQIKGLHLWSLMDNWEWARGFTQRWGLVHVDYPTQQRTPKKSARWYADLIRSRRLS